MSMPTSLTTPPLAGMPGPVPAMPPIPALPQVDVNAIVKEVKTGAIEITTAFTPQKIFFEIGAMVFIWINSIFAARKASIETAKLDRFQYDKFILDVAKKAWVSPDEVEDRGTAKKEKEENTKPAEQVNKEKPLNAKAASKAQALSNAEALPNAELLPTAEVLPNAEALPNGAAGEKESKEVPLP